MQRQLIATFCLFACLQAAAGPNQPTRKLAEGCESGCEDGNEIYETTAGVVALVFLGIMGTSCCIAGICYTQCNWDGPNCSADKTGKAFKIAGFLAFMGAAISAAVHYWPESNE